MKKTLKSKVIHTSKRTYFLNLFEIENGETMISITESRKTSSNEYQRNKIKIFNGDIEKFLQVTREFVAEQ